MGLLFQYGQPVELAVSDNGARETYLGYCTNPNTNDLHLVAITFYRLGHGTRDVDILREAGMMQHVNHRHVMPKFFGMAVVDSSSSYCQWVTVMEYVNSNSSLPTGKSHIYAYVNPNIYKSIMSSLSVMTKITGEINVYHSMDVHSTTPVYF